MFRLVSKRCISIKLVDIEGKSFTASIPPLDASRAHDLVKEATHNYVEFDSQTDFKKLDFTNLALKYKIIKYCIDKSSFSMTNVDLSNIIDVPSLIECLSGKWALERKHNTLNEFNLQDPVRYMFESKRDKLPTNLYFLDLNSKNHIET